jgi:hypothetical protein
MQEKRFNLCFLMLKKESLEMSNCAARVKTIINVMNNGFRKLVRKTRKPVGLFNKCLKATSFLRKSYILFDPLHQLRAPLSRLLHRLHHCLKR